ncbi:histamine N-methyltransferase-like [Ptychodera flava]|uniref:histamine N-methyltransferase-like n=1 Tax=Ptychodera flava TaxID=63121 RepID=UPI00396A2F4F
MAADKVTIHRLIYDPEHYTRSFEIFAEMSSKYQVLSNWCDSVFPDIVCGKLELVNAKFGSTFRMLGVGSGSGETDLMMILHLLKLFPSIHNIVVEPTADLAEKYRGLVQAKQHLIEGVETEWREQTLEGFQNSVGSSVFYHFISAIHSLYFTDDLRARLCYLYDLLEEGGVLLIVIIAEDTGHVRVCKKFQHLESDYLMFPDADHVRKAYDEMGVKYQCVRQRSRVLVTECLRADSEAGSLLLDFLLQVSHFRKTAPPKLQKEVLDYIESAVCCDSRDENEEMLLSNDWEAIIVQKSTD